MVAPTATPQEPTPEFNENCLTLLKHWDSGVITSREVLQRLNDLTKEALNSGHVANQGRVEHLQGYVHHYLGNFNTSILHYERARRYYVRAGNRRRIATIDLNQGENYRLKGEFSRARSLYRTAFETADTLEHLPLMSFALTNEGLVLISVGDYQLARESLEEANRLSYIWDGHEYEGAIEEAAPLRCEIYLGLAEIDLHEANNINAWQNACHSLENARIVNEIRITGFAYRVLGDVMTVLTEPLDPTMPTNPDEYYRLAMAAFRQIQAEGEMARTLFSHAKSFAYRKSRLKAAQMFREAMVVFTRLGMTHDAVRAAEAQLKVL